MNDKHTIALVSLGCDKNRIDSEIMLGILKGRHVIVPDPAHAEVIIVNTCGFIDAAKEESINTILELAEYKKTGKCFLLMGTGCLTQRFGEELMEEIPELDVILGVNSYGDLNRYIEEFAGNKKRILDNRYSDEGVNRGERVVTTSFGASAYLRIGEGCDMNCTYCIIPRIRGKYRSQPMEDILSEAEELKKNGVSEIIVIAQDTTKYGMDIYGKPSLHELLLKLSDLGFRWIRVMYMYPEGIYRELIETIAGRENLLPYFDMPIQHVSDRILKKMGRRTDKKTIENTIDTIRQIIPEAILRTTFIVGFPGEKEEDIDEITEFLKEKRLQKVGAFTYSREEGTPAYNMENQIPQETMDERFRKVMMIQQKISEEIMEEKVGKTYEVLIESGDGEEYTGRSFEMAPEIDGEVIIENKGRELMMGEFTHVLITSSSEYDLYGEVKR